MDGHLHGNTVFVLELILSLRFAIYVKISRQHEFVLLDVVPLAFEESLHGRFGDGICREGGGKFWKRGDPAQAPHAVCFPTATKMFQERLPVISLHKEPRTHPHRRAVVVQEEENGVGTLRVPDYLRDPSVVQLPVLVNILLCLVWTRRCVEIVTNEEHAMLPKAQVTTIRGRAVVPMYHLEIPHILASGGGQSSENLVVSGHVGFVGVRYTG
mmetsp:Transcript_1743/g.4727  ORF Transcript_1743/g.4727 Transcript_1743/m.4727 type:complete len:213 (+) Transcript_1743:1978-2616(+)